MTTPTRRSGEARADRQNRFLIAIRDSISCSEACKAAGVARSTIYKWIREDTDGFAARYEEANQDRVRNAEALMYEVLQWAHTPERFEKILRYPTLLMFALKGNMPEKYGERTTLGQETARQLVDELMKMRDDSAPKATEAVKTVDDQLDDIFGR